MAEKKLGAVSMRFTEEQHAGLEALGTTGLDKAQLVRIAVDGLLDYAKVHGGRLILPLDFTKFFTELNAALTKAEEERDVAQERNRILGSHGLSGINEDPAEPARLPAARKGANR